MTDLNNCSLAELSLNDPLFSSPQHRQLHGSVAHFATLQQPATRQQPISQYYANVSFNRMQLSETVGANIKLNSSR